MDVRFIGKKSQQSGVLFDLTDSSVVLAPIQDLKPLVNALVRQHGGTLPPIDSLMSALPLRVYRYVDISRLTLQRRGRAGKGFLLGAGLGVILGFIQGGDTSGFIRFPASFYAIAYGVILSGVGLIIGSVNVESVNIREQSVATEVPKRFQRFTIVEQFKQASLYTP
ncbi:hypothetical protein HNV11_02270 [Spirosoma taeanense]|uniref:Uncharacterized protein n=1 Tax=Spirosoma taeanense TaxID=2735870 RepID=A0A6M5Y5B5_9BACT|nr:hypothetical protein [Spirosoma taeanense]QJW88283.1 hypothetical protein HNV11_02270 [Spirosoma taeanense]